MLQRFKRIPKAKDAESATAWLSERNGWRAKRSTPLKEFAVKGGKRAYAHAELHKTRRGLDEPAKEGAPFAFAWMQRERGGSRPSANHAA